MRKKLLLPFKHWRKAQRVLLLLVGVLGVMLPTSAQTPVYSNDFSTSALFNAMTVVDANNDGSTWSRNSGGYAEYHYSSSNVANDWLITPGITLEAGKTYQFDIDAWARSTSYKERLEVKLGTAPNAAGMTTSVIASTDITSTSAVTLTNNTVTVASTGVYYFGIHAISNKDMFYLYVDNLLITDVTPDVPKPTDLTVSNVTHNSATASWTGNNDAQSYNLRYREVLGYNQTFFESFENSFPGSWTIIDSDGDGINWTQFNPQNFSNSPFDAYDGSYGAMSRSWQSTALTPDNWLISPQVDLGGVLKYYVHDDGAGYPETYRIYVSTTGTNIANFIPVTDDMQSPNSADWVEQTVNLSAFEGQRGYIAFRQYNCTDQDFMLIDALSIDGATYGDWVEVDGINSPYTITGLEAESNYVVQVQTVYGDGTSDWTSSVNFTTLAVPYVNPPVNLEAEGNAGGAIEMNWEMPVIRTEDFDDTDTFTEFSLGGITATEHSGAIGNWTLYDANGTTTYGFQSYTVPNLGNPMGWMVFAPGSDQLTTSFMTTYPPHSGDQFMASFCVASGATDHWLISPLLSGEEQTISFYARELTTQYGDETFEVLASSTDNSPASFTSVASLSSNSTNWTEYTATLPAGTKYFAIRHTSNDIFALYVDDVTFIPADPNTSSLPAPDAFNIYLDGELVATVNGDVMTYTIQGVDPGEYVCSVTAVYDDLESDSATATAIVPVPQSMTLAELVANGEVGIRYTISESLLAVYGVGNKLWLKDDNKYATKATPAEGDQNYEIILQGNPHENQDDYDQSNWIEVQLADGSEAVENLVGTIIKADKITGTFSNKTNPTMTGVTLVVDDDDITFGEDEYMLNYYCTANFVGPQNGTIAGETYHFFFMTPKPQEYAKVVWAKYDAASGKMIMPSEGNGHGFHGEFEVDLSLNSGTSPEDGKTYNFEAIVRMIEPTGGNTLRANKSNDYIVYPLNLSDEVVTGINNVTCKTVAGVKYYNLAGIESDRPFEGVNIIVTTFTDGSRSSAKVLK